MRKLALLGIELLSIFLVIGVAGFAFLYFRGDERILDRWPDAAVGATALALLLIGRVGVRRANTLLSVLALLICAVYAAHFVFLYLEEGAFPNSVTWIAAIGSVVGAIATIGSLLLRSPPVSKKAK